MADGWDDPTAFGLTAAPPAAPQAAPASTAWDDPSAFGLTPAPAVAQSAPAPAPQPSMMATAAHGLGLGVRDVLEGAVGPAYEGAAIPLRLAGLPVNSFSDNLTALGLPQSQTPTEQAISAVSRPVAGVMTGQGVGKALMGAASPIVQSVGDALTQQPLTQAASAATGGAVENVTGSPIAGTVAALALPLAGGVAGKIISPNIETPAARAGLVATADANNIPLSIAQRTGSVPLRTMESTLAQLPSSGPVMGQAADAQQEAFNRAVLARAGIDAPAATSDVLNAGRANIGQQFTDLANRNTLNADDQFYGDIGNLTATLQRYATPDVARIVGNHIGDTLARITGGEMPGQAYRQIDSQLGRAARGTTDGDLRYHIGDLRDALRGAMDRSISPEDQQGWQDARRQYGTLMDIAKVMNRPSAGGAEGDISTAALAGATNNSATKSYAFGRGNLNDLARLGQGALKDPIGDSKTAIRTFMTNLATGVGGTALPALLGANPMTSLATGVGSVAGPYLAAKAYNSNALARYFANDMAAGITPNPNANLLSTIGLEQEQKKLTR